MSTIRSISTFALAFALFLTALPAWAAPAEQGSSDEPAARAVVNINTADEDQLALLPRVGPVVAGRIVEYRETEGEFQALEELMLVRGIGEKTFELLEPFITLSGETTLKSKVKAGSLADDS